MSDLKRMGGGAAAKILMPVIATLASALASYLAKKAPQYLEQNVMPKLRETSGGSEKPQQQSEQSEPSDDSDEEIDELEQRRRERAEHRASRRKAS
jgi:hypothetical protein